MFFFFDKQVQQCPVLKEFEPKIINKHRTNYNATFDRVFIRYWCRFRWKQDIEAGNVVEIEESIIWHTTVMCRRIKKCRRNGKCDGDVSTKKSKQTRNAQVKHTCKSGKRIHRWMTLTPKLDTLKICYVILKSLFINTFYIYTYFYLFSILFRLIDLLLLYLFYLIKR